jgi:acetate kinase
MEANKTSVLIINSGSSSIKFSWYAIQDLTKALLLGELEINGTKTAMLHFTRPVTNQKNTMDVKSGSQDETVRFLIDWFEKQDEFISTVAIGHRIVHGMKHTEPEKITPALLNELKKISAYDPEHLPAEIKLIEEFTKRYPALPQIACFDTSFHSSMPRVAKLIPIPRKYFSMGIQRYGFHGLSYAYLMDALRALTGNIADNEKIILAHLGNGASLAAIKDGKSIDTSMGFTPTSGLPMSTRTGDLDPGVAWYFMQEEKCSAKQFNQLINHQSGLLGISETNADMRELIKLQAADERAADAIELFCYQTKKWIGSFAAVLGGLDSLVFTGGIGENAPEIRTRVCHDLQFLGIQLDEKRNANNEAIISTDKSKVTLRVIKTNEELMIAKLVCKVLDLSFKH